MSLNIDLYFEVQTGNTEEPILQQEVFSANITHNLNNMAEKADFYDALWHLEYIPKGLWTKKGKITLAKELFPYLEHGLNQLKTYPEFFKQFSASNGWGTYEQFIPWIEKLIEACKQYPDALVRVSI